MAPYLAASVIGWTLLVVVFAAGLYLTGGREALARRLPLVLGVAVAVATAAIVVPLVLSGGGGLLIGSLVVLTVAVAAVGGWQLIGFSDSVPPERVGVVRVLVVVAGLAFVMAIISVLGGFVNR